MPVTPTYPGVYIEEVPSGVRTITGVATAITAFIGRAPRGAVSWPVRVQNFGDYTRAFGGLSLDSPMSFAVQQFFNNGGTDAIIVRVYEPAAAGGTGIASAALAADMRARGRMTLAKQPSAGDSMILDTTVYTFEANGSLTEPAALGGGVGPSVNVEIGATLNETQSTLVRAINRVGASGYIANTPATPPPSIGAADTWVNNDLILTAAANGTAGNNLATTSTFSDPANAFDDTTLGGVTQGRDLAGAQAAQGTLTIGAIPGDGQTFAINGRVYTFQANGALTDVDGNIELGPAGAGGLATTRTNIVDAINATPGATGYAGSTIANQDVSAAIVGSDIVLTATASGVGGNAITLNEMFGSASNHFDAAMLGATRSGSDGQPPASFTLEASNPGAWAGNLRLTINHNIADPTDLDAFNLLIEEVDPSIPATAPPLRSERYFNVSVDTQSPLHVDRVLASRSSLVRVSATSTQRPGLDNSGISPTGGADGDAITNNTIADPNLEASKGGLWALQNADLFNILCIPSLAFDTDIGPTTRDAALRYCKNRRAFFLVDPPSGWTDVPAAVAGVDALNLRDENAAVYFPRVNMGNPLRDNQLSEFVPCGVVAGIYARTDAQRGVWKAPAGTDATMAGVRTLSVPMTDGENGLLNPLGVNCLRSFPVTGNVVWGARTLEGADQLASEWKYVPVRRTALFLEETLYRGLKWVVFEPNDEPLWAQIRLNVGSFMHTLYRQGAFQGSTPRDAYLVKCDSETTTQADIDRGVVNILVGFAPLKPAEFVFVKIQQLAGQLQT